MTGRTYILFIALGCIFSLAVNYASADCTPVRVMPLGDSITVGVSSGVDDPALWVSYREALFDGLTTTGRYVDFVGNEVDGWAVEFFDSNHEGHGGWTSARVASQIYQLLVNNPAEIILLHIGTNNVQESVEDVEAVLNEIDRYETDSGIGIAVIVAQIIQGRASNTATTSLFNQNLAMLVADRNAAGDNLILVDMEHALIYPDDMFNSLHPNTTGYAKLAGVWQSALEPLLPICPTPDTQAPNLPSGVTGSALGGSQITLSWNASTDTGGSGWVGYRIYRDGIQIALTTLLSYTDTGLIPLTSYTYSIEAYDLTGNASPHSNPVGVSTTGGGVERINVGGGAYMDSLGNLWSPDNAFNTGVTVLTSSSIGGTADATLYQSQRWDPSANPELEYRLAVPSGDYSVSLYFAETFVTGPGERVFDVRMEGALVLDDVDIYGEVGSRTALVKTVAAPVTDGELNIAFVHQVENPTVAAIEVIRTGDVTPDTEAPSVPMGLSGNAAGASRIALSWNASSDTGGSGLAGYRVFRNGVEVGTVTVPNFSDTGLQPVTLYTYTIVAFDGAGNVSLESVSASVTTLAQDDTLRINAGGGEYTDVSGMLWSPDNGFNTGDTVLTSSSIGGTADATLYQSQRWDPSANPELEYRLAVLSGNYSVSLYFAETFVTGPGERVFDVHMEGASVLDDVDIYGEVGSRAALVKTVAVPVTDGELNIAFVHQVENPTVAAIEVIRTGDVTPDTEAPSVPMGLSGNAAGASRIALSWNASSDTGGSGLAGYRVFRNGVEVGTVTVPNFSDTGLQPVTLYTYTIVAFDGAGNVSLESVSASVTTLAQDDTLRINAGGGEYTDVSGMLWSPDNGFNTGDTVLTSSSIGGTADATLYQSQRWDPSANPELEYRLAVLSGNYSVSLYFAETFVTGPGERVFDVHMEGASVLDDVDIYGEVGSRAALVKTVAVPVTDGELNIAFVHQVENPTVAAIEVIRTGDVTPDTEAPSVPIGLSGNAAGASRIALSWNASSDTGGSGLAGYRVFRDGVEVGTVPVPNFSDTGLQPVTLYTYTVVAFDGAGNVSLESASASVTTLAQDDTLRINAGGGEYTDVSGMLWSPDNGFNTGDTVLTSSSIGGTADATLYQSQRWDPSANPELEYRLAVLSGNYSVSLYFAETFVTGPGERVFDVHMEGASVLDDVDIYGEVGSRAALVKTVAVPVTDGELNIAFVHQVENPTVAAIEVIRTGDVTPDTEAPSVPIGLSGNAAGASRIALSWNASSDTGGSGLAGYRVFRDGVEVGTVPVPNFSDTGLQPVTLYTYTVVAFDGAGNVSLESASASVTTLAQDDTLRINAGGGEYTDVSGMLWSPDNGFNTGDTVLTSSSIGGTADATLYQSQRWDPSANPELEYRLAVPSGGYSVSLYFVETFVTGPGERVFDVRMEGVLVLDDVDIYGEVGPRAALVKTVAVPVTDGELNIAFAHQVENPTVAAIEVIPN